MRGASVIVGTAGHIDHGKTSLVRTLTGVDPDALPEEKARGITIALGFAPMTLSDGRTVAFIDVPGHEKLVRTMVAGAAGIDAVLLCVSAVDGAMPQTREHLAILGLLGITEGAVVLTMADLVDPEMLDLAREDVEALVAGTFLDGKPILAYSSVTGAGKDALIEVIGAFSARARPADGAFRLPIDRAFVRPGFGTVVTGTAWSGRIEDDAVVSLHPGGKTARVRGIQVHGEASASAVAGWRAALNLSGVDRDDVPRGTVVVVGPVAESSVIDVRYRHLAGAPPLEDGAPVRILHGTAERMGHLHLADERDGFVPGATVWAELRLDAPLVCWPGDRFIARRPSPEDTLGGGEIVDPWAPRLRPKDRARCTAQLARLYRGDRAVWLERAGEAGLSPAQWAERAGDAPGAVVLGDRVLAGTVVARLEGAFVEALGAYHAENPLALGANRRELHKHRLAQLTDRAFDALIERLATQGTVITDGALLRMRGFSIGLSTAQTALHERIRATVKGSALEGVLPKDLHERHPEPEVAALVQLIEKTGNIVQVSGLGWVAREVLDDVEARVARYFGSREDLTPGDFKDLTGLSRKAAIPWLEWLDRTRITKRVGDVRKRGPAIGG